MNGLGVGDFLVTYLLHSTVILALTLGVLKLPAFRSAAVRDVALRFALIAGLFTAALSPLPRPGVPLLPSAPSVREAVSGERTPADVTRPGLSVTAPQPPAAPSSSLPAVDWAAALLLASALFAAFRLSAAFIVVQRGRGSRVENAELRARVERLTLPAGRAGDIAVFWTHFEVPCATGLRSILLPHDLPQRLSAPELDAVLAHECAHLLRRDPLWQVALSLLTQCLWFQPLNLLALSAWRNASEECCDAWAAQHTPRLTLAQAIVTLAGPRHIAPPDMLTAQAAQTTHLSARIHALLSPQESRMKRPHLLILALGPSLLGAGLPPLALAAPTGMTVVLDAAHGGSDPGAVGFATEADVVLAIARQTRAHLEKQGIIVVMTRALDDKVPLEDRVARIPPNAAAYISIHANASEDPSAHGVETFIASPETNQALARSQRLGRSLQTALLAAARMDNTAVTVDSGNTFYVLRKSPVPAALIEVGYVTNAAEARKLQNAGYQDRLAGAIAQGVLTQKETDARF